jgi:hypothetical protein
MLDLHDVAELAAANGHLAVIATVRADGTVPGIAGQRGSQHPSQDWAQGTGPRRRAARSNWPTYDRTTAQQRRAAVLIQPTSIYSN